MRSYTKGKKMNSVQSSISSFFQPSTHLLHLNPQNRQLILNSQPERLKTKQTSEAQVGTEPSCDEEASHLVELSSTPASFSWVKHLF